MDVTKPYEFIGYGDMDVTKPCEFIGFGDLDVTKHHGLAALDAKAGPAGLTSAELSRSF